MERSKALIKKDLLDVLRDPKAYVGFLLPLIIFAAFGVISEATAPPATVSLSAYVNGSWPVFTNYLKQEGVQVLSSPKGADAIISFKNISGFVSFRITFNLKSVDQVYYAKAEALNYLLSNFTSFYRSYLLKSSGVANYKVILNPVNYTFVTNINNVTYPFNPMYIFEFTQVEEFVAPTILFALSLEMAEMSATLITVEQEEKTFEVLLSMPVKRHEILLSKIISSFVISMLSSAFYFIGLIVFSDEYFSLLGLSSAQPISSVVPLQIIIIFIILVLISTIFSSSLGLLIGLLSKDLRVANVYLGLISVPILIPTLFFIAGGSLSYVNGIFKAILLALPPTYAIEVTKSFITRVLSGYWALGIFVGLLETFVALYVSSLILSGKALRLKKRYSQKEDKQG